MNNRPSVALFVLLLCLTSVAFAESIQIPVTPQRLETPGYRFSVETANTADGWATFQVKITAKSADFPPSSSARLAVVTKTIKRGGSYSQSITPFEDARVELEKAERTWNAKFTVSQEMLKKPGLAFVFEAQGGNPNSDFYILKLQDFLRK